MSDGEQSLSDLLDQWRRILDGMGATVLADLGPGLNDRSIGQLQDALGIELLPELREFLAWGVATNEDGARGFLPRIEYWSLLSPRRMVRVTKLHRASSWRDILEESPLSMATNDEFVVLFQNVGIMAMDHHRPAETCGGIWQIDEDPGWAARDLRGLIGSCVRMFEHGLLELNDIGMVTYSPDACAEFARKRTADILVDAAPDHPMRLDRHASVRSHLMFRWDVIDNPKLWTRNMEWVW